MDDFDKKKGEEMISQNITKVQFLLRFKLQSIIAENAALKVHKLIRKVQGEQDLQSQIQAFAIVAYRATQGKHTIYTTQNIRRLEVKLGWMRPLSDVDILSKMILGGISRKFDAYEYLLDGVRYERMVQFTLKEQEKVRWMD